MTTVHQEPKSQCLSQVLQKMARARLQRASLQNYIGSSLVLVAFANCHLLNLEGYQPAVRST